MCSGHSTNWKVMASVQSALIFAIIASPQLFGVMQGLLGSLFRITTAAGVPTTLGLLLHAVVYGLIVYGLMAYKKKRCGQRVSGDGSSVVYGGNSRYPGTTGYGYGSY